MKKRKVDVGESSHCSIEQRSSEGMSEDLLLEPKHKIFLSHSGVQKEFVEHLCEALEERCRYPFFDKRPESLPKGKEFSGLIVKAAQQCQMLVVVVSEEYFMSKWPMIELNAFVQASKVLKSNMNVAILPLFYGLSVSDLKDEKRRQTWLERWKTFAKDDPIEGRIKVEDWSYALDVLTKFNGLPYERELKGIVAYENEIVSHICTLIQPDIKWDDSHVQGNAHEVVLEKRKAIGLSPKYKVQVVGIYRVGGIGKTTLCKRLCNELSNEYEGRVCHVEFDITCSNSKELLRKACIELCGKQEEVVHQLGEGKCQFILKRNASQQKGFLALDNVWDDDHSIKQALLFLNMRFHKESFVVVTARSQNTLDYLGIDRGACLEMPELGEAEATKLFLDYAAKGKQFAPKDMIFIEVCIQKCFFCKGDGRGFHYHPMALEVLGRQLGCLGEVPSEWVQKLGAGLQVNVVFDVLKIGFDLLQPREQDMFMDVGFFASPNLLYFWGGNLDLFGWWDCVYVLHKQNDGDIQSRLNSLIGKGLLQDLDFSSRRINMHDLYIEFAKLVAKGNFIEASNMWNRRWMYVDDGDLSDLEATPVGGCWLQLTHLSIHQYRDWCRNPPTSLEGIEWHYFSNVVMLVLDGLSSVQGTLNLKGMKCLQILRLKNLELLKSLEGFSGLSNLSIFEWSTSLFPEDETRKTSFVGHFPTSLKFLGIRGQGMVLEPNVFARCNLLCKLTLIRVDVGELLDLSTCSSMDTVDLRFPPKWQTMLVLCTSEASKLKSLYVTWEHSIFMGALINISVAILGLDQVVGLERLFLNGYFEGSINLLTLTKLQSLEFIGYEMNPILSIPPQVQKLSYRINYRIKGSLEAPFFSGFNQLEVLNLSFNIGLIQLFRMGDLPALQSLDLSYCESLERLPDLSTLRSLKELDLDGCSALKLHEEDIQMLAALPLLHPVPFSDGHGTIKVDFFKRKVLRPLESTILEGEDSWLAWEEGEWKEEDIGQPPIGIFQGSSELEDDTEVDTEVDIEDDAEVDTESFES